MASERIDVVLVAGGKYHDIDHARLELLKLLAEDERIRVRVFEDYTHIAAALPAARFLVTYTCDVVPSLPEQEALRAWVEGGGRWYALHGTNSILRFTAGGVEAPRWAPLFMDTLGSTFVAHPPIRPYRVDVTQPEHPLVKGVEPFDATDEQYLVETYGDLDVFLHTDFEGAAEGFVEKDWPQSRHPVFYLRPLGAGAVLYNTLGHCRGHYDMTILGMEFYPNVERGSWDLPVYYDLLRRGLAWCKDRPAS